MKVLRIIINLAIFVFLLIIALNNMEIVELNFLGIYTLSIPLVIALVVFMSIGFIIGIMLSLPDAIRLKNKIRKLNRELTELKTNHTVVNKFDDNTQPTHNA